MCKNVPDCIFSATATGQSSKTLADFPWSRLSKSFTAIQLRLPMDSFRPKLKLQDVRVGLVDLTTGRNLTESAESTYIRRMMDGQMAETLAQEKLITKLEESADANKDWDSERCQMDEIFTIFTSVLLESTMRQLRCKYGNCGLQGCRAVLCKTNNNYLRSLLCYLNPKASMQVQQPAQSI